MRSETVLALLRRRPRHPGRRLWFTTTGCIRRGQSELPLSIRSARVVATDEKRYIASIQGCPVQLTAFPACKSSIRRGRPSAKRRTRASCLLTCGDFQPDSREGSGRLRVASTTDWHAHQGRVRISVGVMPSAWARGLHVVESTRIARSRLEGPLRVARARRDGRGGSSASGRPRDVGPRRERWRALERQRDAAFEPPPFRTRICLSRVLTPPVGETRRRISNVGGVAMVVSRDARLRS